MAYGTGIVCPLYALILSLAVLLAFAYRRRAVRTAPAVLPVRADAEKPPVWLSQDWEPPQKLTDPRWLTGLIEDADADPKPLKGVLEDFRDTIESDSVLYMLFCLMFQEVPHNPPYNKDPTGNRQIKDYHHMLRVFNHALTRGPPWRYSTLGQQGLVGFPFSAVLDWPMGTAAGTVAFIHPKVNDAFKRILDEWARYLQSPDSVHVLCADHGGWLSDSALRAMARVASDGNADPEPFENYYICDPSKPHYGFTSWDHFFTRQFRAGLRPVASPDNDAVIVHSCESSPLRIRRNVNYRDTFWLKSQPYSLIDMLAQDELAQKFVGGTVYQAFLNALSYHRWHSPISGTVVKIHHQPGTYYAENYWEGFGKSKKRVPNPHRVYTTNNKRRKSPEADPSGPNKSQGYLSEVAARGMIYIQSDNPLLGLVCAIYIGIAEVSSCDFTVQEGQRVQKGEQLGMFHYGGSTYCLLFQAGVELEFVKGADPGHTHEKRKEVNVRVNSELARIR